MVTFGKKSKEIDQKCPFQEFQRVLAQAKGKNNKNLNHCPRVWLKGVLALRKRKWENKSPTGKDGRSLSIGRECVNPQRVAVNESGQGRRRSRRRTAAKRRQRGSTAVHRNSI